MCADRLAGASPRQARSILGVDTARASLFPSPPPEGVRGDPGLFGPSSTVWRVARERALLLGGQASLLLQLAHPLIAAAVAAQSGFRSDPLRRLRQTLDATLTITFGDSSQAHAAAGRVAAVHRRVHGVLSFECGGHPAGTGYDARDPGLGLWVHATLVVMALKVHTTFVGPLGPEDRARYYEESKRFAAMFGVTPDVMPATYADFGAYVGSMLQGPSLEVCREARTLGDEILRPGALARLGWAFALGRAVTAGLLPERFRVSYDLPWGLRKRSAFEAMGATSRLSLLATPARLRYWPHYLEACERSSGPSRLPDPPASR